MKLSYTITILFLISMNLGCDPKKNGAESNITNQEFIVTDVTKFSPKKFRVYEFTIGKSTKFSRLKIVKNNKEIFNCNLKRNLENDLNYDVMLTFHVYRINNQMRLDFTSTASNLKAKEHDRIFGNVDLFDGKPSWLMTLFDIKLPYNENERNVIYSKNQKEIKLITYKYDQQNVEVFLAQDISK